MSLTDTPRGAEHHDVEDLIVYCPANGREVARVPALTAAEVAATATQLRSEQPAWAKLGVAGRKVWLGRWRDWMMDNERHLAQLVQQETGRSRYDAQLELAVTNDLINYYADNAAEFLCPERRRPHGLAMAFKHIEVQYHPYALVGVITPWNGPIGLPMMDVGAALMAGCAVLTKPSELTPVTWLEVVRGWREDIGAPAILGCATGAGMTGAGVVDVVDMVQFTGSVRTGRKVAARCAERLVPYSLELGGKDAMIVLADADVERAANAACWGGFVNSGQACVSVERVYVEAPVYDEFVQLVKDRAARLRVGSENDERVAFDYGAMSSERQLALVQRHVDDALERGARALTGGRRLGGPGTFFEPTVLVDVDHSMACMREETFGPTLPIMRVENADEAVQLANDTMYGLSASVWTRDTQKGRRIAGQLAVGAVNINNVIINVSLYSAPMSGWGESGIGSRFGDATGMRKYCRSKAVVVERVTLKRDAPWYPATARRLTLISHVTRFLGARDWRRRLGRRPKRRRR
jgi:acyl-CoA reductase-like NAD-dependent aldehyde dehydrogenase